MKKLLIIVLLFVSTAVIAQKEVDVTGNFTIETVEYGTYINNEWVMDGPPAVYESLFKITKNMVKQVNSQENWTYYIEEGPVYNEEHKHWVFLILDKDGIKYMMIVDFNNTNLRFIYKDGEDNMRITRFSFSNMFGKV